MKYGQLILPLCLGLLSGNIFANLSIYDWQSLQGYTVIHVGSVTGYIDNNTNKSNSWEFEGCDYDRRIIVDEQYSLTCTSYGYSYAYHPDVVIFANKYKKKMLVNDNLYDVE